MSVSDTNDDSLLFDSAVQALLSPLHQAMTKEDIAKSAARRTKTIQDMRYYWNQIQTNNSNNKQFPPRLIHITGTKGKGSTACMCESILRHRYGLTTGLFTSPHLMDIRERIRWNGIPVHPNLFGKIYWKIRSDLEKADRNTDDDVPNRLPGYFRMLTLMAMYAFCCRPLKVDVVILEVGMGGRYDATNFLDEKVSGGVLRRACGVTLLDLDHTRILGNTLEQIAWEKGGIFTVDKVSSAHISSKPGEATDDGDTHLDMDNRNDDDKAQQNFFILDSNTNGVLNMMRECAKTEGQGTGLALVDAMGTQLRLALQDKPLGLAGQHQYGNATLAIHLCHAVMVPKDDDDKAASTTVESLENAVTLDALRKARWPGRCQTVEHQTTTYPFFKFRLDGAHTPQSLSATMDWFNEQTPGSDHKQRVLVFNCSHERNPVELLQLLLVASSSPGNNDGKQKKNQFSLAYFAKADSSRPSPVKVPCARELLKEQGIAVKEELMVMHGNTETWQETLGSIWNHLLVTIGHQDEASNSKCIIGTTKCNMTASQVLENLTSITTEPAEVFVTGSLYLVGSFLTAIQWSEEFSPDFNLEL